MSQMLFKPVETGLLYSVPKFKLKYIKYNC